MSRLDEVLGRLSAAGRTPMGGSLAVPVAPEALLAPLHREAERLARGVTPPARPTKSLLAEARSAWVRYGRRVDALSPRQIRALCWEPEMLSDPAFARGLELDPRLPANRRWLEGLAESYFARWRGIPDAEVVEATLRRGLAGFRGRAERLTRYREAADPLFSPHAARWLAERALEAGEGPPALLEAWRIGPESGLGRAVADEAVEAWLRRFGRERGQLRGEAALSRLHQLTSVLLASGFVEPRRIAEAVGALVLWDEMERDDVLQGELKSYLLSHPRFGDPRLPRHGPLWDLCQSDARQRFIGWMARADLLFFFQTVIVDDPHGRRDFWLRYIDLAIDSNVALSEEDQYLVRSRSRERLTFSSAAGGQGTSAFIMRFRGTEGDLICIEFSQVGNALYVHEAGGFARAVGGIRNRQFHIASELKHRSRLASFRHAGAWQWNVQSFLASHGIRPR